MGQRLVPEMRNFLFKPVDAAKEVEAMSKDLNAEILRDWDSQPNEVTVRKIRGTEGQELVQMRLDLGVLQMEMSGRPDGKHPHGFDTLLDYHQEQLRQHRALHGETDDSYTVSEEECDEIRREAMQFYYRYLSLFHLGDYYEVIRDTNHNVQLFDFVRDHAIEESDRISMEQFRPYVLMMNARARACIALERQDFDRALELIDMGIEQIQEFLSSVGREELMESCREVQFLEEWKERILSKRPLSEEEQLRQELRSAVEQENYELAAQLRDRLKAMAH